MARTTSTSPGSSLSIASSADAAVRAVPRVRRAPMPDARSSGSAAGWCAPAPSIARWASAVSTDVDHLGEHVGKHVDRRRRLDRARAPAGGDPAARRELRRSARRGDLVGDASTAPNGSRASVGLEVERVLGVLQAAGRRRVGGRPRAGLGAAARPAARRSPGRCRRACPSRRGRRRAACRSAPARRPAHASAKGVTRPRRNRVTGRPPRSAPPPARARAARASVSEVMSYPVTSMSPRSARYSSSMRAALRRHRTNLVERRQRRHVDAVRLDLGAQGRQLLERARRRRRGTDERVERDRRLEAPLRCRRTGSGRSGRGRGRAARSAARYVSRQVVEQSSDVVGELRRRRGRRGTPTGTPGCVPRVAAASRRASGRRPRSTGARRSSGALSACGPGTRDGHGSPPAARRPAAASWVACRRRSGARAACTCSRSRSAARASRAGTPCSSITRSIPASIDSAISHWAIGVVPPGKWERSSSQRPGPGASKVVDRLV